MLPTIELTAGKTKYAAADHSPGKVYLAVKRCFDFCVSLVLLIVLLPLFCIIAILIKHEDGGPVIHRRTCVGKKGPYDMLKFRTMVVDSDNLEKYMTPEQIKKYLQGIKLENDARITKIGNFLRKTSIDELPQLLTVLKSDMSLIGPRPVIEREAEEYGAKRKLLLSCKPGITGWWQVMGRGTVPFLSEEGKALQLYYVQHQSMSLDIRILLKTVKIVLSREGAR